MALKFYGKIFVVGVAALGGDLLQREIAGVHQTDGVLQPQVNDELSGGRTVLPVEKPSEIYLADIGLPGSLAYRQPRIMPVCVDMVDTLRYF